jgi:diguanylate cyclase (GGDEF)-like protein/PAS domain S-box-containing protein
MALEFNPYSIPLIAAAAYCILWMIYTWRYRPVNTTKTENLILLIAVLWNIAYILELDSINLQTQVDWAKIVYVCYAFAPTAWLVYAFQYTVGDEWLTRRKLALLSIVPIVTALLILTNEAHGLMWNYFVPDSAENYPLDSIGIWQWFYLIYSYVLISISIVFILLTLIRSRGLYRFRGSALLLAVAAPWLASIIVTFFDLGPITRLDWTPVVFGLTFPIIPWLLPHLRTRDVRPVARDKVIESIGEGVIVLDESDRVLDMNSAAQLLIQLSRVQVLGQALDKVWSELSTQISSLTDGLATRTEVTLNGGGQRCEYELVVSPLADWRHRLVSRVLVLHDITERKQAEARLRESEERYALATRGANDGLWDWDLRSNEIYYSPRWKEIFGCPEDEIRNSPDEWFDRVHNEDLPHVKAQVATHLDGLTDYFNSEHRMTHKDGTSRWVHCRGLAVRDTAGVAYRMAGSVSDITARKRAEEQLVHDAFHDSLTGLPNRALFLDRLGRSLERAKRSEQEGFAVLYLDLDRFKVVNDSLGHSVGDELLIESARRLEVCVRSVDTVARLGGDEFVILLESIADAQEAVMVTDRILSEFALPFNVRGNRVFNSASIGVVERVREYKEPENILRDADIAMYRAKSLGKARYEIFTPTMRDNALGRMELEKDLRAAIERKEFRIQYQPILSLEANLLTGFEALLRWQHPRRGLIMPLEFIPVAEETGLIIPLGQWVLREACRQIRVWQLQFRKDPPLSVNVNLSAKQFAQPELVTEISRILQETGLDPSTLGIEVTESVLVEDPEAIRPRLTQLRELGVSVQIDDFGTGYSSLSYLQYLPIDTLKIDRAFVGKERGDGNSKGNGADIVRTIVSLAHDLGLKVTAEGIETTDQLAWLVGLGCEFGQGYLLAKPLDREAAVALIAKSIESDHSSLPTSSSTGIRIPLIPTSQ